MRWAKTRERPPCCIASSRLHDRGAHAGVPLDRRASHGRASTPNALTDRRRVAVPRRLRARLLRVPQRVSSSTGLAPPSSWSARSSTSSTARSLGREERRRRSAPSSTRRPTGSAKASCSGRSGCLHRHGNEVALAFAIAAIAGSFLVSYTRAKAEALGLRGDVGLGSRAERVVVITAGLGLAPWGVLPWAIYLLTVTAWMTVLQRILHVRRQLRQRLIALFCYQLALNGER